MRSSNANSISHNILAAVLVGACTVAAYSQPEPPIAPPPPPVQAPAADLPDAAKLLEQAQTAMGGKEKIEAITSFAVKATLAAPMAELLFHVQSKKTGAFHLVQNMEGRGSSTVVFDGKHAWVTANGQYQLIDDAGLQQGRQQFEMLFPYWMLLRPQEHFKSFQTIEKTDFQGQAVFKVKLEEQQPSEVERFAFFDEDEHLLRGMRFVQDSPLGQVSVDFAFDDWKEVGDLKVFNKVTIEQFGQPTSLVYNEVEFNKVDDAIFAQPTEVKELIEKSEAPPVPATPTAPEAPPTPAPAPGNPPTTPPPPPGP